MAQQGARISIQNSYQTSFKLWKNILNPEYKSDTIVETSQYCTVDIFVDYVFDLLLKLLHFYYDFFIWVGNRGLPFLFLIVLFYFKRNFLCYIHFVSCLILFFCFATFDLHIYLYHSV